MVAIYPMRLEALVDKVGTVPTPLAMAAELAAMPLERAAMNTGLAATAPRLATSVVREGRVVF